MAFDLGAIFPDIDPNATSGTELASLLNDFKDIIISGFGTTTGSRPASILNGGMWVDAQNAPIIILKHFDGADDITIMTINYTTNTVSFGSSASPFSISQISADSLGPILRMVKERIAANGQCLDGDTIGLHDFIGKTDAGVEEIVAQIETIVTDDMTAGAHGSRMRFLTTPDGGATLTERMVLHENGHTGLGASTPEERVHVKGSSTSGNIKNEINEDSAIGPKKIFKKTRVAASGQVASADIVGESEYYAADENGAEVLVARIQVKTNELTQSTQHGADLIISAVRPGETALTEFIKIENGVLNLGGLPQNDTRTSSALLAPDTPRDLADIDGTVYGAFEITVNVFGRDNVVEYRKQKTIISGVYNSVTSSWDYSEDTSVFTDTDDLLTFTYADAQTLNIDYNNQFVLANFVDGEIYVETKRYLRS